MNGVHFRGEWQHGVDVSQQKTKCGPIKTGEIDSASLSDVLYVRSFRSDDADHPVCVLYWGLPHAYEVSMLILHRNRCS